MKTEFDCVPEESALKEFQAQRVPFTPALFARGHSVFAPILTWEWVVTPSREEMRRQLEAAKRAGFGTVYILPMPKEFRPDSMVTELEGYLTPAFFENVKTAVRLARSLGLRVWLYDEGGWPSGNACGRVAAELPQCREKRLTTDADGTPATVENPRRADVYSPQAAAYFAQITHDAYAAALGRDARAVEAIFTDEPAGNDSAVSEEIFSAFSARYGYDLRPLLPAALNDASGGNAAVRRAYYRLLCDLFCNTVNCWREAAAAHGWLLAGHLDRDHTADANVKKGYGNFLRALKTLDIPGVDAIDGQIASAGNRQDGEALDFYPRFASSAAVQQGTPLALSESFAVYGNALSGDELRYILNYQLVRGITLFNFMQMPSSVEKWYAFSERPIFHPAVPGFYALDGLLQEIERACLFMGTGLHCADVALFYPHEDLCGSAHARTAAVSAFRQAGDALERAGVDFDIIDAETIREGILSDGCLRCGGASYRKILCPSGCELPPDIEEKLSGLRPAGSPLVEVRDAGFLSRAVRDAEGDLHICVFNQSRQTKETAITVNADMALYRANPREGTFSDFENGGTLRLCGGECALLLATDKAVPTVFAATAEKPAPVALTPLSAAVTARFVLSKTGAALCPCAQPLRFADDYTAQVGTDFSGEITLSYAFSAPAGAELLLEADRLCHFAEIFVNDARVGALYAAPYRLRIKRERLLPGENRMTVKLSNLPAAAFAAAAPEQWFLQKELGPYHARTLEAERQVKGLGLAGLQIGMVRAEGN